ncbi:MAG: flagellar hook-associated protein 3 FlgL [Thermoleophilaceae bacterium]|nr:flagellar hook-associated protein 3 FlgL [Thermoleophilaceae bacterium]
MSTRITGNMISRSVLSDLNDISTRLAKTQERMSSGKQITRPSDDPYGTSRALSLSSDVAGTQQYQRNVSEATAWENVTDAALSKITDAVHRARELAVQGASDSAGQSARTAAAAEIDQLIASVKQEANASYGGRYVFSGTKTNVAPYDVTSASDAYSGDAGTVAREIGPGVSVQVNVRGVDLLGQGQLASDGKLLNVLRDLSDHLKSGTVADMNTLRTSDLKGLDTNLDAISQARATVGATTNRLESADSRLQEVEGSLTKLLSDVEDADMAQTAVDYSMQQSVYQSALHAGANIVQQSLLDFLR